MAQPRSTDPDQRRRLAVRVPRLIADAAAIEARRRRAMGEWPRTAAGLVEVGVAGLYRAGEQRWLTHLERASEALGEEAGYMFQPRVGAQTHREVECIVFGCWSSRVRVSPRHVVIAAVHLLLEQTEGAYSPYGSRTGAFRGPLRQELRSTRRRSPGEGPAVFHEVDDLDEEDTGVSSPAAVADVAAIMAEIRADVARRSSSGA